EARRPRGPAVPPEPPAPGWAAHAGHRPCRARHCHRRGAGARPRAAARRWRAASRGSGHRTAAGGDRGGLMGTGRRRRVEVFSLSFLDCICCGFGAVVLFYTIVAGQSGIKRLRDIDTLQAEVNRVEEQVLDQTRNLVLLRNTLEKTEAESAQAATRARQLSDEVAATQVAALRDGATSMA